MTTRRPGPRAPHRQAAWFAARPQTGRAGLLLLVGLVVWIPLFAAAQTSPPPPPDAGDPILYGLDPLIRTTRNPLLLGEKRLVLRQHLRVLGVDTDRRVIRPSIATLYRVFMDKRINIDLDPMSEVIEADVVSGLYTRFRYPKWFFLFPLARNLSNGFTYFPPRPVEAPEVELFVDDLDVALQRQRAVDARWTRRELLDIAGGGRTVGRGQGMINFTIPIKLPRTLESVIGRGEKTKIRITGREHIAIRGETSRTKPWVGNERVQSQSWFPDLDMEQQLRVSLEGQIGEKIFLEVDHDSEAFGPEGTNIKLDYRGLEDEIIRSIEAGDVGLTLPGGQLLGYNSNKSGLFGIKVTGQLGPAEFTVVASKQKSESDSKSFNSSGGEQTDHPIESWNYLNNRFFRLDLPPLAVVGNPEYHKVLGYDVPDDPGRSVTIGPTGFGGDRIDRQSIRIYRNMGGISPGPQDIQYIAAAIDPTGVWDPATIAALSADPGQWKAAWVWRPVDFTSMETVDGDLIAVDLGRQMAGDDILAVTYDIIDTQGNRIPIGDKPELGPPPTDLVIDGQPYYRMKLLKPEQNDPFTYQYVMRNIYSLGGINIDSESFQMSLVTTAPSDLPEQHGTLGLTYMNVFGLDVENEQRQTPADGLADKHITVTFDLTNGLLKFPLDVPRPFAADRSFYEANAAASGLGFDFEWDGTALEANRTMDIYLWDTPPTDYHRYGTFRFVPSHAAASSVIQLGASNIEEGSEQIILDGRTLVAGEDYEIDYLFGTITLKGDAAATLQPDSNIQVNYQFAPFFGGGQSSLLGFNVAYDLGRESKLSTTWLYESNNIAGHKAKIGEEPSHTLVGNLNLSHTLRSQLLTDLANVAALGNREKESEIMFRGEAAISVPDPNTKDKAYLEDFEGAESSNLISLTRLSWHPASRPVHGDDEVVFDDPGDDIFASPYTYLNRAPTNRWYVPEHRVKRGWLNPSLMGQERDETQQALELYLATGGEGWQPEDWGGIIRGVSSTGLDLGKSQFLEFWVNDYRPDPDSRRGRLHFDFGVINEDFIWGTVDGEVEYGTFQLEDLNQDGVFNQIEEDVGLDAVIVIDQETGRRTASPKGAEYDYQVEINGDRPYPAINNTAGNNHEDSEDIDGNTRFDQQDGFYSVTIDLKDAERLVDVAVENPGADLAGTSWRKYRIRLSDVIPVELDGTAAINAIRHVRLWYDDPEAGSVGGDDYTSVRLQFSELSFLGSRWERQGIRKVETEAIVHGPPGLGPDEGFFIGEVNNKENPEYARTLPFHVHETNNIPEKETSLVLDFNQLRPGHLVRIAKQVSAVGDDYTRYKKLSWWWWCQDSDVADIDVFYRIGADSTNFYEISTRFVDLNRREGWRNVHLDLVTLTNIKTKDPDDDGIIRSQIPDARDGRLYDVRIVGRPDLKRVTRFYFGVANGTSREISGQVYMNDIIVDGVKRDVGLAESVGLSVNLADVLKIDVDWDKRDAEFHGLNQETGQGVVSENWSWSTNFKLNDFIPLAGFNIPLGFSRQFRSSRPKYELNSDIEILDEDRKNDLSSVEDRNTYSIRLSHRQSRAMLARYIIDPWNISLNGAKTDRNAPTEISKQTSLQGSMSYNLSIPGTHLLSDIPLIQNIPVLRSVSYLPTRLEGAASFTRTARYITRRDTEGNVFPSVGTVTKPGSMTGSLEYRPLPTIGANFTNRSARDMLRRQEIAGINIGEENNYQQSIRLSFALPKMVQMPEGKAYAPLRWTVKKLNKLRPSLEYDGGYENAHDPGTLVEGDPDDLHSVGNSSNWKLRGRLPVGDLFESVFPERKRSQSEQTDLIREQERLMRESRGTETVQFDPARIQDWEDMTPDQQREAREKWLLEQAEERLEEEETDEPKPAESSGTRLHPLDLIDPMLGVLRDFEPLAFSYSDNRNSGFGRLHDYEVGLAYKFGFQHEPDIPDTLYSVLRLEDSQDVSLSTSTRITRDLKLDFKYSLRRKHRIANDQESWNYSQQWPDVAFNLGGIERWGVFGGKPNDRNSGWFKSSSFNVAYKYTKDVTNYTEATNDPRRGTTISPRWNFTFHNGLRLNLNGNMSTDNQYNSNVLTTSERLQVGLQVQHQFRAQRLLSKLNLTRLGRTPTIDMTLDMSYNTSSQIREAPGALFKPEPTGQHSFQFSPRFSYSISQNLTGAFSINYSRSKNIGTDVQTTAFGIGLEVDFVF